MVKHCLVVFLAWLGSTRNRLSGRVGCPFVLPSRKSPIEFAGDKAGAVPQCLQERGHPYGVGPQGVMKKFGEM